MKFEPMEIPVYQLPFVTLYSSKLFREIVVVKEVARCTRRNLHLGQAEHPRNPKESQNSNHALPS